jgi:hypothetical protein
MKKVRFDRLAAIVSIFISLAAAAVSIWAAFEARRQGDIAGQALDLSKAKALVMTCSFDNSYSHKDQSTKNEVDAHFKDVTHSVGPTLSSGEDSRDNGDGTITVADHELALPVPGEVVVVDGSKAIHLSSLRCALTNYSAQAVMQISILSPGILVDGDGNEVRRYNVEINVPGLLPNETKAIRIVNYDEQGLEWRPPDTVQARSADGAASPVAVPLLFSMVGRTTIAGDEHVMYLWPAKYPKSAKFAVR